MSRIHSPLSSRASFTFFTSFASITNMSLAAAALLATVVLGACGGATGSNPFRPDLAAGSDASAGGCDRDAQCSGATPRCDLNTRTCVACLPLNDNCPKGQRCVSSGGTFQCSASCVIDGDCPRTDGGAPTTCCKGSCFDTGGDINNCGACGKSCVAPANGVAACIGGMCGLGACLPGFFDCNKSAQDGCEVDGRADAKNCGACGNACNAGVNQSAVCEMGACKSTCAMGFADCNANPNDGCEVDTGTSAANCGGCAKACSVKNGTPGCRGGACIVQSCDAGYGDCNMDGKDGCETDVRADLANCGKCGAACKLANSVSVCRMGSCGIDSCSPGFVDCDSVAGNGCEVDSLNDPKNCGACARACLGAQSVQGCAGGACTITSCSPGFSDCDKAAGNGCEINVGSDAKNCGGCGNVCPSFPNAVPGCANAQCVVAQCNFGFADCNMNPLDGCEVDLRTLQNCGACGNACPNLANASSACNAGVCGLGACLNLFGNCDNNPGNGCEKNLSNDAANCGKCGTVCSVANGTPSCVNGACAVAACNAGFGDCDKSPVNGCEVNLNTNANNCGACGFVCPVNTPNCSAGKCVALGGDYGPAHTFAGLTSTHYITQGGCSTNGNANLALDAAYFCTHFYGQRLGLNCVPLAGWVKQTLVNCAEAKMHKNGGCTSLGNDIPNTVCDANVSNNCKIGNWNECTTGLTNLICRCQ